MHTVTSRKIVAYGKNEFGGREQVADKLTKEESDLLYAVLRKARKTCKERIDYVLYGHRLKRITEQVEALDFDAAANNYSE